MKVTFENSNGEERVIGEVDNEKEAYKIIINFLNEHNFKSYYVRYTREEVEHRTMFDVGSHTEFFYVYD